MQLLVRYMILDPASNDKLVQFGLIYISKEHEGISVCHIAAVYWAFTAEGVEGLKIE